MTTEPTIQAAEAVLTDLRARREVNRLGRMTARETDRDLITIAKAEKAISDLLAEIAAKLSTPPLSRETAADKALELAEARYTPRALLTLSPGSIGHARIDAFVHGYLAALDG